MSVLLVTDDADDDIQTNLLTNPNDCLYKQLKELEYYDFSSSVISFPIVESSSSIIVKSNKHSRQHRHRRRCRLQQQCLLQHLLTYMLTLLILTNHLHWPVIILSLSSIKIMSTQASTIPTTTAIKRPIPTPSNAKLLSSEDEQQQQQCLPVNGLEIDRMCSKTCRARKTPFEKLDPVNPWKIDMHFLPFCSSLLDLSVLTDNFLSETTEHQCRQTLQEIADSDEQARKATESFAVYMSSIDSASKENRYSIIPADCPKAYRTWACSIRIPYFHQNQLIPPCQTICDEVERVCPTFRPSEREPLFAGQPLFFCDGGIVGNNDYGQRPHCFDSCHLYHGSLRRPSSILSSNRSSSSAHLLENFLEGLVTTPTCFEIEPLPDELIVSPNTSNTSLSASAMTITWSYWSFIFVCQMKFFG